MAVDALSRPAPDRQDDQDAAVLAGQLFTAALACAELMAGYLGLELGLYEAMREPGTSAQLAERAGVHERYAREWLEQQAAGGTLRVDDARRPAALRAFHLPPGHARALLDPASSHYSAPLALLPVGSMTGVLPRLAEAFRRGTGVADQHFAGFHGGGLNAALYEQQLPGWLRQELPDVHRRLATAAHPCIADLACGTGASTIELARAYPRARVDGYDLDRPALRQARQRLDGQPDLASRARFLEADISELSTVDAYDLVCAFDSLHDMAQPVAALRACRRLVAEHGCVLLLEPRAQERFTAPADLMERFIYACSLLHCLPIGISGAATAGDGGAATGAVLRPAMLRGFAAQAGFSAMHVLAGGSRFHRLYRLDP